MRTSSITAVASLVSLTLVAACESPSDPVALKLQAHSFANSEWSEPVNIGTTVNSNMGDQAPALSKDGLSLYFASNRPGGLGGNDFWVSQRLCRDCAWEAPVTLGPVINSSAGENKIALSPDGHLLFFSSNRAGGHGEQDIWVSRRTNPKDNFAWEPPVNLGPDVNTASSEQAPFYLQSAEDGSANLYFNRGLPAANEQDIYVAAVTRDGQPRAPAVIVAELNDPAVNDASPALRSDGREIFFLSSRAGALGVSDLYTATRQSVHSTWSTPVNLGAPWNTAVVDFQPSLSHDGRSLVFVSNRPGSVLSPAGVPSQDIWMSTRTPSGH